MTKSKNHTDIEDFYNSTGKLLTNVFFDDVHGCKQSVKTVKNTDKSNIFPPLLFNINHVVMNFWGVNKFLFPKGHEIHSTPKLKHCICEFFNAGVSGTEVNKRISFWKQSPQVLPFKVSDLLPLSPLCGYCCKGPWAVLWIVRRALLTQMNPEFL